MRKNLIALFMFIPGFAFASGGEVNILGIVLLIVIFVLVFLVLREFVCWYYKVNERLENQREIIRLLKELVEKEKAGNKEESPK